MEGRGLHPREGVDKYSSGNELQFSKACKSNGGLVWNWGEVEQLPGGKSRPRSGDIQSRERESRYSRTFEWNTVSNRGKVPIFNNLLLGCCSPLSVSLEDVFLFQNHKEFWS